jgi:hypothetical protein
MYANESEALIKAEFDSYKDYHISLLDIKYKIDQENPYLGKISV